jgi:peptidoglycan hydrolase CwlO-like protein
VQSLVRGCGLIHCLLEVNEQETQLADAQKAAKESQAELQSSKHTLDSAQFRISEYTKKIEHLEAEVSLLINAGSADIHHRW